MNPESTDVEPNTCPAEEIPWYVNGTLASGAAAKLGAHLAQCRTCRDEYDAQVRLFDAMRADTSLVFAAEPSFRKLMARLGTQEDAGVVAARRPEPRAPKPVVSASARPAGRVLHWLTAAVVLEALVLGYGGWAWHAHDAPPRSSYVTLSTPAASYRGSPRIRVVFRAGLSVRGLGLILHDTGAHIIDGPTDSNVYTLGFTGTEMTSGVLERRVAALRANADVLFAEPVSESSEPR
ncbi:MAG TPA: hypothetical protein VK696_09820 [Steroidobacteraceae bacterium]|nr:hypothetical protein [Steroidobacteraceae bacterium]